MKFALEMKWRMFLPGRINWILGWSRALFFLIGLLSLGYVGFSVLDARRYQTDQYSRFEVALKRLRPSAGTEDRVLSSQIPNTAAEIGIVDPATVLAGDPLGRIEIDAIGLATMIQEGVDDTTLRRSVGHIPGTPLPGQRGNVALAGHRDTFFKGLREIRKQDEIVLTTLGGSFRYRVDSLKVVRPEETGVLADDGRDVLTLVTCYPFRFVGSAPERFIVRASRISE